MNLDADLTLRKEITVRDIPGCWTTNLSDDDLREFYPSYCRDATLTEARFGVFDKVFTIRYTPTIATVPFRDGACLWCVVDDRYTVIYRTNHDWELWRARKAELDELCDEESIEIQLFQTEDQHLSSLADDAIRTQDFDTAEVCVAARADLRRKFQRPKTIAFFPSILVGDAVRVFAAFPTVAPGLAFLREYHLHWWSFHSFAEHFQFRSTLPVPQRHAQIERIYDDAVHLFPNDAKLYKSTCLFWRREKRMDLAIKYYRAAIERDVRDDTKSGFQADSNG